MSLWDEFKESEKTAFHQNICKGNILQGKYGSSNGRSENLERSVELASSGSVIVVRTVSFGGFYMAYAAADTKIKQKPQPRSENGPAQLH